MAETKYKRVLIKLSGEALAGEAKTGIDSNVIDEICDRIIDISKQGIKIGIVVGGGNFWRGRTSEKIERTTADYMGMLATIMNGLALQDVLKSKGVNAKLKSSMAMDVVAEQFKQRDIIKELEDGDILIFAGGTGHPFFSTDTAAALRATEMNADVILVGKTIDAVYSADPKVDPNATRYESITFGDVLEKNLKVMDAAAISICRDNNIPLLVFGMKDTYNFVKAANGENVGTIVK